MCSPDDLPRFVYAPTTHADDIARYGKLVIEGAEAGDDVARDILARGGSELAECVLAVARKLHMADTEFAVAYVGGAFHAGVEGAAMMAMEAAAKPRPGRG